MDFIERKYTLGEEIFNAVSHGTGALLSIAGCVVIIVFSAIYGEAIDVASSAIYGSSLIILYTMSTLYHAITHPKAKRVFRILDYSTIFLLVAGTYTPLCLSCLGGVLGWTVFGVVWAAAVLGIIFSSINLKKFRTVSTICYIVMGWGIIALIPELRDSVPKISLIFLILGGVFYTGGVVFFRMKNLKYMHSIWHLFVIAGSIWHYFSIFFSIITFD